MTLFEAGILAKMTTDEYKNLPEQSRRSEPVTESDKHNGDITGDSPAASQGSQVSKALRQKNYIDILTQVIFPRVYGRFSIKTLGIRWR